MSRPPSISMPSAAPLPTDRQQIPLPGLPHLLLRPMQEADLPSWAEFALLPEVQQHTSSNLTSLEELRSQFRQQQSSQPPSARMFAVVAADTPQQVLAAAGFHSISARFKSAELSYDVRLDCWRGGIACAATRALLEWGFSTQGWLRIQATAVDSNLASQAVLLRCGFVLEGRLRNFRLIRGEPREYLVFSRIPTDPA